MRTEEISSITPPPLANIKANWFSLSPQQFFNVPSTSAVVSHVTETEEVFLTTLFLVAFPSLEALKSAITNYERSTYCHYVVRDSHFGRDENSYVKFVCWRHGRITSSGSSRQIRRRRASMNTQCPTFMFCKIIDGYWTVVRGNVHHNHECDSLRYQGNSWVRRLKEAQFENERPLLISGTASFHIRIMLTILMGMIKISLICGTKCSHTRTFLVSNLPIYDVNDR
ncbi:unnamed protein product [Schistosoma curassoni]|uniref:FAR1 domain-containing protein n=1 Tax=Schistosoma curassoni TaxID=6186 RepID=A0A183JE02_9TREM|nr:unnamed protein product [Schistosoma curassoni]